jgi:DNA-binding SARP family transcriptional activator
VQWLYDGGQQLFRLRRREQKMGKVSLYLFGAPHIEADGASVKISRRKALALLAYLAADERAHSRESLAALLWPEWDTTSARTALRRVLVTAHKAAGPEPGTPSQPSARLHRLPGLAARSG